MKESGLSVFEVLIDLHKAARSELNEKTHLHKIQKHNAEIVRLLKKANEKNSQNYYGA